MLTYEDFLACGNDEAKRRDFITTAISQHINSEAYRKAEEAQLYYDGENPTINRYEKLLYDMQGRAHADMWTANHKIASQFFSKAVNQEVAYLLGNGVRFSKNNTKKKLGKTFDLRMMRAEIYARVAGQSFGFWNLDHVEIYKFKEFVPILGEETGEIMVGIRFWRLAPDKPMRITLFELDGFTEYKQEKNGELVVTQEKRAYKITKVKTEAGDVDRQEGENYDGFPIVPLYANEEHKSSLNGKRNTIDALDIARSGMVNNVSEGELIYWVLTNCGGMDDLDDAKFIERIHTTHVAHADGDANAKAEAHTIEAPVDASKVTVDDLRQSLYDDFDAFDPHAVTASNQSATAVKASYVPLDLKCDVVIEPQVTEFILRILKLAGIDDEPTYQRNQIINKLEETQTLVMQAEYFNEEYIIKKLLAINGDIDMYDEMMKQKDAEAADKLKAAEERLRQLEAKQAENTQPPTVEPPEEGADA